MRAKMLSADVARNAVEGEARLFKFPQITKPHFDSVGQAPEAAIHIRIELFHRNPILPDGGRVQEQGFILLRVGQARSPHQAWKAGDSGFRST
jgi:hypothetical protein